MKYVLQKITSWLLQYIFILIVDFSLGGMSFFALAMTHAFPELEQNSDNAYLYVIFQNTVEAVIAVVILNLFLFFLQNKIQNKFLRYILLLTMVYIPVQFVFALIRGLDTFYGIFTWIFNLHPLNVVFSSNLLTAVAITYYWLTREHIRTMKITEQEYQLLKLNELKTKAELEALQAKINPHFLYNALNSIAGLIHEEPDKAEKMVVLLARFFRYSTGVRHQYISSLAAELEMVKTYLEVEKVRFEDRLEYSIVLEDEQLKEAMIPSFLLQPLIENSIKHGLSKLPGKGEIKIRIHSVSDRLLIHIHDNGKPFPENIDSGYGLQSTQDKLRLLGGENASMSIKNEPQKEIIIELTLNPKYNVL